MAYGVTALIFTAIMFMIVQPNLLLSLPPRLQNGKLDLESILLPNKGIENGLSSYAILSSINAVIFAIICTLVMNIVSK